MKRWQEPRGGRTGGNDEQDCNGTPCPDQRPRKVAIVTWDGPSRRDSRRQLHRSPDDSSRLAESAISRRERRLLAELRHRSASPCSHLVPTVLRGNALFDAPRRPTSRVQSEGRRASQSAFPRRSVGTRRNELPQPRVDRYRFSVPPSRTPADELPNEGLDSVPIRGQNEADVPFVRSPQRRQVLAQERDP
jgi:hypothetical protein